MSQGKSGHVTANGVMLLLVAAGGFLLTLSTLVNIAMMALGVGEPMPEVVDDFTAGQFAGQIVGYTWGVIGGLAAGVLCGLAGWRLLAGHPKARKTAIAAWIVTIPACCCFPLAGYGLWSLTRPALKAELD